MKLTSWGKRAARRAVLVLAVLAVSLPDGAGAADWPTYHRDQGRTGYDNNAPQLTPLTQLWSAPLDGKLYASPVVASGKVLAATENDTVYAFNVADGTLAWQNHLATPVTSSQLPCGNIGPVTGITGTPVVDTSTGTIFVVTFEAGFNHRLWALDLGSGSVKWNRVVNPVVGDVSVHQQRPALALGSGKVYISYGGLEGDCGDYHGAELAVNEDNSGSTAAYTVGSPGGAIWSAAGPSIDSFGNVYVTTGNGDSDHFADQESVIKLSPALQREDSFTPSIWSSLDSGDTDLGSLSPVLIDGGLVFAAGKDGIGYLARQTALGGIGGQAFSGQVCDGAYGGAAYASPYIYMPCTNGVTAVKVDPSGPSFTVAWRGNVPGSPIVAAGEVWALDPAAGKLVGMDANSGQTVASLTVGSATRFSTPTEADGRIFLSLTNKLLVLGGPGIRPPDAGRPWPGGSDAVGIPSGGTDAYFAEGFTGANFHEYLTVQNPGAAQTLTVQYLLASGSPITKTYSLAAASRTTMDVNADVGYGQQVGAHLSAPNPFVAERPMYFNYQGRITGGDDVMGAQQLGQTFYFAEGYTGFDEYLTLLNPSGTAANVTVTYYYSQGAPKAVIHSVPASSRLTVNVDSDAGAGRDVSMKVTSDQPILAERPIYFNYYGRPGGHVVVGAASPVKHLDLAEGFVGGSFDEYLTLLNPGGTAANATITYFIQGGGTKQQTLSVGAGLRATVHVNTVLPAYTSSSVRIDSDQPLVVERPMYFSYQGGWTGGHDAVAVDDSTLGKTYLFAEGYVSASFAEYYTILNPNSAPANVTFIYYLPGGGTITKTLVVGPQSRGTELVDNDLGPGTSNSAMVTADQPVLVERPTYFDY